MWEKRGCQQHFSGAPEVWGEYTTHAAGATVGTTCKVDMSMGLETIV